MTIAEALAGISMPVCHPPYGGGEDKYVTYHIVGQTGTIYAESVEAETGTMFAVDFFTRTPPFAEDLATIRTALQTAGFASVVEAEIYETDTGLYHISMTASCVGGVYG